VGADEYTYRRLSRMQQHPDHPMRGVIKVSPECVIVLDTSGSMGAGPRGERVSRALTAIAQGVRRLQNPRVISWDDGLRGDKRCASIRDFQWVGGGGTGMEDAIEMADKKYRPDCIVLVTDCGTGWPEKPTRARLVVAAVAMDTKPPKWARVVDLTKEVNAYVG
jgi:predicted metal-dependent peptidase